MKTSTQYQLQLEYLNNWLKNSLVLDAYVKHSIEFLYKQYLEDIRHRTATLGVKPKIFSKELRLFFEKEINVQKVRLGYKREPIVEGIDLKDREKEDLG